MTILLFGQRYSVPQSIWFSRIWFRKISTKQQWTVLPERTVPRRCSNQFVQTQIENPDYGEGCNQVFCAIYEEWPTWNDRQCTSGYWDRHLKSLMLSKLWFLCGRCQTSSMHWFHSSLWIWHAQNSPNCIRWLWISQKLAIVFPMALGHVDILGAIIPKRLRPRRWPE